MKSVFLVLLAGLQGILVFASPTPGYGVAGAHSHSDIRSFLSAADVVTYCLTLKTGIQQRGFHLSGRGLSQEQEDQIKEAFGLFDTDGNGKVTWQKLGAVLNKLGQRPSEWELKDMISDVDKEGKGYADLPDFLEMMQRKTKTKAEQEDENIEEAFKVFDRTKQGRISASDLRHVMERIGEKFTDEEVDAMIREVDSDGDGYINFKDFHDILKQ